MQITSTMKLFIVTLIIFCSHLTIAQNDSIQSEESTIHKVYILDMVWKSPGNRKFETDGIVNYLIIKDNVVTLFCESREERFVYESPYIEFSVEADCSSYLYKFIGERNYKIPARPSFEILEEDQGEVLITVFPVMGGGEKTFFKAHSASKKEIQTLNEQIIN